LQKYNEQEQYKYTSYMEQCKDTTNRKNVNVPVTGNNTTILVIENNAKIQLTGTIQKY